ASRISEGSGCGSDESCGVPPLLRCGIRNAPVSDDVRPDAGCSDVGNVTGPARSERLARAGHIYSGNFPPAHDPADRSTQVRGIAGTGTERKVVDIAELHAVTIIRARQATTLTLVVVVLIAAHVIDGLAERVAEDK